MPKAPVRLAYSPSTPMTRLSAQAKAERLWNAAFETL
jgi:hypothetical protein